MLNIYIWTYCDTFHIKQTMCVSRVNGKGDRGNASEIQAVCNNRKICWIWYGDRIQQYEVSLSRMLNDILTLDQQWLPNQSDFPPISWPWYRLWPSPNYEWFPWSICNRCGMPAVNAYPSGHLVPFPYFGTCWCSNCCDQIPRTCQVFTRFFTSNTPWHFLDFASNALVFDNIVKNWKILNVNISMKHENYAKCEF